MPGEGHDLRALTNSCSLRLLQAADRDCQASWGAVWDFWGVWLVAEGPAPVNSPWEKVWDQLFHHHTRLSWLT